MNKQSWVARPSGNMTLEVFDEETKKQIVKIDMLKANTMKAGSDGDILCKALNDLSIITLFPEIFSSLYINDLLVSRVPIEQGWEYAYKWLLSYGFKSWQSYETLHETSIICKKFIDILPYNDVAFSQFPWINEYIEDRRRFKVIDSNGRVIAEKIFSKTVSDEQINHIRLLFEVGIKYLNQFLFQREDNCIHVALI